MFNLFFRKLCLRETAVQIIDMIYDAEQYL